MCGRLFCLFNNKEELIEALNTDLDIKLDCRNFQYSAAIKYNICPTTYLPVLTQIDHIESLHWGFKIFGLPQIVINARNEEVETKKSFKNLIDHERCIVICSGYYEWQTNSSKAMKKSPYSFRPKNKTICYLAALKHTETNSVVLMTREAVPTISHIHTRMPVLLRKDDIPKWLDNKETPFKDLKGSIIENESYTGKRKGSTDFIEIEFNALANYVNSVKVTGPECLQSLKEYKEKSFSKGIGKFFPKADK